MAAEKLETLITRLETVTGRLESVATRGGSGGGSAGVGGKRNIVVWTSLEEMDGLIQRQKKSKQVGWGHGISPGVMKK